MRRPIPEAEDCRTTPAALGFLVGVLLVSNIVFLIQAASTPWLAVAAALTMALGAWACFPRLAPWGAGSAEVVGSSLLVAFVLCILGGEGHILHTTADWVIRDAVLADVVQRPWPVTYLDGAAVLRAPVGFYILPALIGRVFGLEAAHLGVLVQSTLMLAAVLVIFVEGLETRWRRLVLVMVFVLFSGWDIVGEAVLRMSGTLTEPWTLHIERWVRGYEYSSFLTDLFWAPNHALPAWALTGAYLCWRRGACSAPALAAMAALCWLWSPLAVMGAIPFVGLALFRSMRGGALTPLALCAAAAVAAAVAPAFIYLGLAGGEVSHGWSSELIAHAWRSYGLITLFETVPLLFLIAWPHKGEAAPDRAEIALIAAMLLALPLYRVGQSHDLMMRASIVPLTLGALIVAQRVIHRIANRRFVTLAVAGAMLSLGAVTPALEVAAAVIDPPRPILAASLTTAWARSKFARQSIGHYIAPTAALAAWPWLFKTPNLNVQTRLAARPAALGPPSSFDRLRMRANSTRLQ